MDNNENLLTFALEKIVKQLPHEIAVQIKIEANKYQSYSYQEFYDTAKKIGKFLIINDIKPNDKIALIAENCPEWGMIYFGILLCGATAVPIDIQSQPSELKYYLEHSEAKAIFTAKNTSSALTENLQILSATLKIKIFDIAAIKDIAFDENIPLANRISGLAQIDSSSLEFPRGDEEKATGVYSYIHDRCKRRSQQSGKPKCEEYIEFPALSENNIASIIYTSGTTGAAKAVMLTHKNYYSNFISIKKLNIFTTNQNILSILPLHHAFPFMATLLIPLLSGYKITYIASLKSNDLLECMQQTKITALVGVPQLFNNFYDSFNNKIKQYPFYIRLPFFVLMNILWQLRKTTKINLSKTLFKKIHQVFGGKMKYLVSGGAKLDNKVTKLFLQLGFDLYEGYGLTETSPIVTLNLHKPKKIDSAGAAIPDVGLKINEPDENGIGEILIQGPNVMLGYFKNEQDTREAIQNNWFFSGDLGYLDKNNFLYITARKKELIVLSSGKNIVPEEVEAYYTKSSLVKEICILEVKNKTEEKLMAVVVPDLEYFKQHKIFDIQGEIKFDLENFSKNLPSYKRIMGFIITKNELQRTRLGKLKRYEIKDKYINELLRIKKNETKETHEAYKKLSENDLLLLNSPIAIQIISIIQKEFNIEKTISLDDHLEIDLSITSLKRMELASIIEQQYKIHLAQKTINEIESIRDLINAIAKLITFRDPEINISNKEIDIQSLWHNILNEDLSKQYKGKISLTETAATKIITSSIDFTLRMICKVFWRLKILGTENLPKNEPFILCANHNSFLDGFIIVASLPKYFQRKTFFLGYAKYFNAPIIRSLIKITKVIPINPSSLLIASLKAAAYILKNQKIICIFPEGARSIDGEIKEFKNGVGILAKELNVKLVPVYLQGTFEAWPRNKHLPKPHKVSVVFGKAETVTNLIELGRKLGKENDYDAIASGIREKIVRNYIT